jgi:tetratricopeptide (TPR) repeat protein
MYKAARYKDAVSEYSSLIKKNKTYSDYYLGRGKCYDKMGESSKAMKDYTEAFNLDPANLEALIQRADLNKRLSKPIDAIADYKAYILSYNENPIAYLEIADLRLLNLNSIDDAISTLDEGINVPALAKVPELYFKRGELHMRKSDWKNAIIDFSSVIKIDSTHKLGLYNRGTCYLKINKVENAAADFENARSKGLDSLFTRAIADFAAQYFDRANTRFNQNALDSAIALVNDAIAIDPYSDKYRFNKGEYYFSLKKYQEAITCYDQAVQININHANAWYKRGLSYHLLASHTTAIESFGKALIINPQYALAKKGIGDAQFALKQYESAAVAYESCLGIISAIKLNDNNLIAEVYNDLGKSYYQLQNYEKSLAALKSAIKKNELFAEAYFNRGLSSYKSGKLDDAIADFDKALSVNNAPIPWKYYQARAYHDANKFDIAITRYTEIISTDTMHLFPDATYQRGKSYYSSKQYQPALADYLAAFAQRMDTSNRSFNYEIGNIYLNIGKYDSAIAFFNKAYAKDSANGFASYGVASSLLLKGNRDEAMVWFEKSFATHIPTEKEIKHDPLIKVIVNDKKFKDLLKKYY